MAIETHLFVDVKALAVFADEKRPAIGDAAVRPRDAVGFGDRFIRIAENGIVVVKSIVRSISLTDADEHGCFLLASAFR